MVGQYPLKYSRSSNKLDKDDDIYEFNSDPYDTDWVPADTASKETLLDGRSRYLPPSQQLSAAHLLSETVTPQTRRTSSLAGVNCNNTNNGWSALSARSGSGHMTSVRAAGYTPGQKEGGASSSLQSRGGISTASGWAAAAQPSMVFSRLETTDENTNQMQQSKLLKQIHEDLNTSCIANSKGDFALALQKAKDASSANKRLARDNKPSAGCCAPLSGECKPVSQIDLTFAVQSNLALQYDANHMYSEALNEYEALSKNKNFLFAGQLRVNMGNIYFKMHEYQVAIKNYMMALDQVPTLFKRLKDKIMRNVAICFFKLKSYDEALRMFEGIMSSDESVRTGFIMILCHSALGQVESMKTEFLQLLKVDPISDTNDDERYIPRPDDKQHQQLLEVIRNDELRRLEKEQKKDAEVIIMQAVRFIAAGPQSCYGENYDWCIDQVRASAFSGLVIGLEIDKAIGYIRQNDFIKAVATVGTLDMNKNTVISAKAATNLSFIYSLMNDGSGGMGESETAANHYADMALQVDPYNEAALVNKGNVYYSRGDYEKALECYRNAFQYNAECLSSIYNLGLANKKLARYDDALSCFNKFRAILGTSPQIVYHFADIRDLMGSRNKSMELFVLLIGMVPSDAGILRRIGQACADAGDKSSALLYYTDAYHFDPNNATVIEWLGTYYLQSQYMEQAMKFFQKGALVEPNNVTWKLMTASCLRRCGNIQLAYETYRSTHRRFPDNVECLRFLVRLGTDMNLAETKPYEQKLKRALNVEKLIRESEAFNDSKDLDQAERSRRQSSAGLGGKRGGCGGGEGGGGEYKGKMYETGFERPEDYAISDWHTTGQSASRERAESDMERRRSKFDDTYAYKVASKRIQKSDVFEDDIIGDDLLPE